ncbi:MAG: hypothetical protein K2X87_25830 [Gemmataceae bacterium]|nr:hypothetical protein [Gemmataceae bacterium]
MRLVPRNLDGTPVPGLAGRELTVTVTTSQNDVLRATRFRDGTIDPTGDPRVGIGTLDTTDPNNPFFPITIDPGILGAVDKSVTIAFSLSDRISPNPTTNIIGSSNSVLQLAFPETPPPPIACCGCHHVPRDPFLKHHLRWRRR